MCCEVMREIKIYMTKLKTLRREEKVFGEVVMRSICTYVKNKSEMIASVFLFGD